MMKILPVILVASILAISGCTSQAGDRVLEDGTVVKSDGTMIKIDGTMIKSDGTIIKPDGTMVLPNVTMTAPDNDKMMEKGDAMMENNGSMSKSFSEDGLTEFADNYYRYDPAAFEAARNDGKIIFLDFHADWCPVCNAEHPGILQGFNSLNADDVVGFQVHYNDGNTKSFDTEAAKEYQVAYQHTKVIIGKDGNVLLKTLEVFDSDRVVSEINKARAA